MKTLDEVIKIFEECIVPKNVFCNGCYKDDRCKITEDALHYLKEYKNTDENYKKAIAHVTEVIDHYEKMVADYLAVNNLPLTWDKLREMEGKPVWVEHKYYKIWLIVKEVYEETIVLDGNGFYTQFFSDDNEKETRWQAYRKERK